MVSYLGFCTEILLLDKDQKGLIVFIGGKYGNKKADLAKKNKKKNDMPDRSVNTKTFKTETSYTTIGVGDPDDEDSNQVTKPPVVPKSPPSYMDSSQ